MSTVSTKKKTNSFTDDINLCGFSYKDITLMYIFYI